MKDDKMKVTKKDIKKLFFGSGILICMELYIKSPDVLTKIAFGITFMLCLFIVIDE